ncbi:hypothetical protein SLA2020_218050 [Shorea laevis]
MAEKTQQVHPLAPANGYPRSDEEAASIQAKELKRKKRIKWAVYIAAFAVFQTIIILVFALTFMRIRNPKVRFGTIDIQSFQTTVPTGASPASFDMRFIAQVTVKNTNFGHYKFDNSTMSFFYDGVEVGQAIIPKARARARSTKKLNVTVELRSNGLPNTATLGTQLSSNVLTLNSQAKVTGKVELMKVMKRKKSAEMECTLVFNVKTKTVQELKCK